MKKYISLRRFVIDKINYLTRIIHGENPLADMLIVYYEYGLMEHTKNDKWNDDEQSKMETPFPG